MQETGNKSNNPYSLSIRFHTDGFSFFICNPQSDKNFLRKDFAVAEKDSLPSALSQALEEYAPLQERKYTIVSALFYGPVSRVPLELFHKERRQALFELVCPLPPEYNIHYNILPHLEVADLFAIPQALEQILLRHFPTIHFYARNSMILERSVARTALEKPAALHVYLNGKSLFLFRYRDKKLEFANEYAVSAAQDALYYILNVWKMLGMNAQTDTCVVIQPENGPQQTVEELAHYLRNIQVADMKAWFGQAPLASIKNIPFDILSLLLNGF